MTAPLEPPAQTIVDVVDRWHRFPLQALNAVHQLMGAALHTLSDPEISTAGSAIATDR